MFCVNCGTKNAKAAKFCSSCGTPTVAASSPIVPLDTPAMHEPSTGAVSPAPAKKILGLKPLHFGLAIGSGGIVVLVLVAVLISVLFKPMPSREDAAEFLLTSSEITQFDVEYVSDTMDYTDSEAVNFIFGDCSAKGDLKRSLAQGVSWASQGYKEDGESASMFSINAQIISFSQPSEAQEAIDAAIEGSIDPECDSPNIEDYYTGGRKISEEYGVGVEGVTLVDTYRDDKSYLVLAKRDKVMLVLDVRLDSDNNNLSVADVSEVIKLALEKFAGN